MALISLYGDCEGTRICSWFLFQFYLLSCNFTVTAFSKIPFGVPSTSKLRL